MRIHKHNNKKTFYKIKQKHTEHTTIHIMIKKKWNQKNMKECDKRKSHISNKLHMIYRVRHKSVNTPLRHKSVNTPLSHELRARSLQA